MYKCPTCNHEPVKGAFTASLKFKKQVRCDKCNIFLKVDSANWVEFKLIFGALLGTSLVLKNYDLGIFLEVALLVIIAVVIHIIYVLVGVRLIAE